MDTTKAEEIIARFTTDPDLTQRILGFIAEIRDKGGISKVSKGSGSHFDKIINEFTSDDKLEGLIKEIAAKVRDGHDVHSIIGYHEKDAQQTRGARDAVIEHSGAIHHIVTKKS